MQYTVLCFVIQLLAAVSFVRSSPIIMNNERKVLMPQQRMTCRLPNNKLVPCSNVPRGGGDEDQNGQIIVNVENNLNPIFKIQLDNPSEGIRSPKRGKSTGVTSSSLLSTVLLKKVQLGQRGLTLAGSSVHSTMKGSVSSVGSSGGSSKVSSLGSSGASLMKMKSGGSSISSSKSSGSSSSAMNSNAGSSSSSAVTMKSLLPGTFESMADSIVSSFMSIGVSHSSGGSSSNNSPSSGHTSTGASHSSVSKMTGGSSGSSSGHSSSSVASSGSMSTMTLNAKISLSSGQASSSVGGSSGSSNASSGSSSTGHTSSSGGSSSARSGSTIELTTPSSIVSEFMEIST